MFFRFLKEEPERLEHSLKRCKKLTGTLVTLKRYINCVYLHKQLLLKFINKKNQIGIRTGTTFIQQCQHIITITIITIIKFR